MKFISFWSVKVLSRTSLAFSALTLRIRFLFKISSPISYIKTINLTNFHGAGDYLISTDAIREIQLQYPNSKINLYFSRKEAYELALLNTLNNGINLIYYKKNSKVLKCDLLINLSGPTPELFKFINDCNPSRIIGYIFSFRVYDSNSYFLGKDKFIDNHFKRNLNPLKNLGIIEKRLEFSFLYNNVLPNPNADKVTLYFPQNKLNKSIKPETCLDFVNLVRQKNPEAPIQFILHEFDLDVFSEDQYLIRKLEDLNISFVKFSDWKDLIFLIKESSLVVCTDSVVFHLSNIFQVKNIGLFGATNPEKYISDTFKGIIVNKNTSPNFCYHGTEFSSSFFKYSRTKKCKNCLQGSRCSNMKLIKASDIFKAYEHAIK